MLRIIVGLGVLLSSVAFCLGRETSAEDQRMMGNLRLALSESVSTGYFEGHLRVTQVPPALTDVQIDQQLEQARREALTRFKELLTPDDLVMLKSHGVRDLDAGLSDPQISALVLARVQELSQRSRAQLIAARTGTWSRTQAFRAWLNEKGATARYEADLLSVDNAPESYNRQVEQKIVGIAKNDEVVMFYPEAKQAQNLKIKEGRGTGMLYVTGQPFLMIAGMPPVAGVAADNLRVLGEEVLPGGRATKLMFVSGANVSILWVSPPMGYRVIQHKHFVNGQLVQFDRFGRFKQVGGVWYPMRQMTERIQSAEVRRDLQVALREGKISTTNLEYLETQKPAALIRFERDIETVRPGEPMPESLFEISLPPDTQVQRGQTSLYGGM